MVDSHAHLQMLSADLDEVIARAREAGVRYILCVATNSEDSKRVLDISTRYDGVYCAVGIHPLSHWNTKDLNTIESLAKESRVLAIGETGLDFYKGRDIENQRDLFKFHIELSLKYQKPLLIHTRGRDDVHGSSFDVCLDMIKDHGVKAIFHSFSWGEEELKKAQKFGLFISISGTLMYSKRLQRAIPHLSLEKTLVETDSPFLSPIKGKENEPAYVELIARKLADMRNLKLSELSFILINNFEKFFLRQKTD